MAKPLGRIRSRLVSGVAVLIPLFVTFLILRALFGFTAGILLPFLDPAVENWPPAARAALSLVILLLVVFALGELATHLVGRRIIGLVEALLLKVPVVRVIYKTSRQVVSAFERGERSAFRSVVLVEFPHPGLMSIGFVTSSFEKPDGSGWHTVFVPTSPNPTSGFLQVVPSSSVVSTKFTVEEAFQMVMSVGVMSPAELRDIV
ncbi:MAG: DUF502 domain-containing protein [Gemmatimonadetes bacterium]|nr:DUF502 domain-containing protein [Gemmatimonadota bacterium]NNM04494.1 DUF502 domain-containing protein [Gemmatimonadota bacterium]